MLEITVFKSRGGRDLKSQWSNSYLFAGTPNYVSDEARAVLDRTVEAESSIAFTDTAFVRATIRQMNDLGVHTAGETRSVPLEGFGLNEMPAGSTEVPGNVTLAIAKQVLVGRSGLQQYRYAVTSDELNAFIESGTAPARIVNAATPGGLPSLTFTARLAAINGDSDLEMVLMPHENIVGGDPRPVTAFAYAGIRYRQQSQRRGDANTAMVEAVQKKINENGRRIASLLNQIGDDAFSLHLQAASLISSLRQASLELYATLSVEFKARINWPAVYDDPRVVSGIV